MPAAAMALLLRSLNPAISQYKDRRFGGNQQEFEECLHSSTTVYVGNLSFFTTEDQIFEASGGGGGSAAALISLAVKLPCRLNPQHPAALRC